ncbi:hypothetical protein GJ744_012482 [Endocarpon pusillum]|uniref:Uncharacterized protein n=1 Tax=Endocarpon pusillum TaxID=364733 RepID=A0A8H7AB14_9EURO|nr:hypothetical protein GJ744_012482 [Endocarpon pusillum]
MHFDGVLDYSQDRLVPVGDQAFANRGCGRPEVKACVGYGQLLLLDPVELRQPNPPLAGHVGRLRESDGLPSPPTHTMPS